jgi:hypothetical protein
MHLLEISVTGAAAAAISAWWTGRRYLRLFCKWALANPTELMTAIAAVYGFLGGGDDKPTIVPPASDPPTTGGKAA